MSSEEERRKNKTTLSRWEVGILQSITREGKSEKEIAKDIRLEVSTVSELITNLMMRGLVEKKMKKRRFPPSYEEYFTITPEGLATLEIVGGAGPLGGVPTQFNDAIGTIFRLVRFIKYLD